MGGPEDKERKDRAVRLLDALTDYYRLRPSLVLALIHDIANDLVDTINAKEDFKKELGYYVGQFKIMSDMLWYHDRLNVIQKAIANPQYLEDLIEAIIQSARAYSMLHSDEPITLSDVANLIEDASTSLYRFLENALLDVDSKL
jgi:hypothetical protein